VSAEANDTHQRELAHAAELHASDQTALMQRHATELARVTAERDEKAEAIVQAAHTAELREQYWETTVASLREAQKKLQREVAEAKERIAALETDHASVEERLATATATSTQLSDDKRTLTEKLEATETEARRNALDRARFVAYLEEGLALLGALPVEPAPAIEPEPKT
jgi:chromosome segregation ATPase